MATQIHPLVVPDQVVAAQHLDLTRSYSTNWGFEHHDIAFSPAGEMYALSSIWRNWNGPTDRSGQPFHGQLITRYGQDGMPLGTTVLRLPAPDGTPSVVRGAGPDGMCVLPDGNLAVTAQGDSTYLLDGGLTTLLAAYTSDDGFACRIRVTPGGRLVCALEEHGIDLYGRAKRNLIALAKGAPTASAKPEVDVIAAAGARRRSLDRPRPYVRYRGEPLGPDNRPDPGLEELTVRRWPEIDWWHDPPTLRTPTPLGDDLVIVPLFTYGFRGGNRGLAFVFALVNGEGELTGRLEGLDFDTDSPFAGDCYAVAVDQREMRAYHLNRHGLYAWDAAGTLLARISTGDKPFTALAHFRLLGCSPAGELVLAHRKQHLLLRVPLRAGEDLADAVTTALRTYTRERTALKKDFPQVNWHWTYTGRLHHV